jgi:hypothetical protein
VSSLWPTMELMLSHGCLRWKASTKPDFLKGITKMDSHDLPLALPGLSFTQNQL